MEIDYPRVGRGGIDIRFRGALEYRDKWGWVSEWLRFRGYDVSGGELRLDRWGGTGTEKYEGTGTRLSTFVVLAQKIGFMDDDRIMPCVLE